MSKIYFVMPAYNEAENIEKTVNQWHAVVDKIMRGGKDTAKLVVANDGSTDNTFSILQGLKEIYPFLIPIDRQNTGHGATVLFLYRYAIEDNCDFIFQTDSDGQTNPDEFWELWNNREKYDFLIGARNKRKDGIGRVIVTKVLRLVVWVVFHTWVIDSNAPFRLMRMDKLKVILDLIPQDFFLCNVAIAAIAKKLNYKIAWYDISFKPRQGGVNSINMKRIFMIGWKALGDLYLINTKIKQMR